MERFHRTLEEAELRDVLVLELNAGYSSPDRPMKGSGMTIINPPFTLAEEMRNTLPWLAEVLAQGPGASARIFQLLDE